MFEIALAIGIFSYSIFFFGLLGVLYKPFLVIFALLFWGVFALWKYPDFRKSVQSISFKKQHPIVAVSVVYLILQACINVVGLFGPEIGFDATWYHLTLPKLYLLYHAVVHFPGSVLYYSDMPHLTEMLYTVGLAFGSDFFARGIHFLFGLLECIVVYKIGRKFFAVTWAILLSVIFYSNLVVGWESISGYIDLSRTFFTSVALFAFLNWRETMQKKYFVYAGICVGLTVATKLLSLWDIVLYIVLLMYLDKELSLVKRLKRLGIFLAYVLLCMSPWMTFSFIHTGNPVFPLFTAYNAGNYIQVLSPLFFLSSVWNTFAQASDPIHPLFLATVPFIILFARKLWRDYRLITLFAIGGFLSWYLTPQTGGGRYILPYLPIFSVLCLIVIEHLSVMWRKWFVVGIFLVALISLGYRASANSKFLPVIFHKESEAHFMTTHLQYNLGDFYDIDGWFATHIKPTDTVLLYGFHNMYYVNFPFILSDWVKHGDKFTYVAVQGQGMPDRFAYWNLVYFNPTTQVRVYSLFGKSWYY